MTSFAYLHEEVRWKLAVALLLCAPTAKDATYLSQTPNQRRDLDVLAGYTSVTSSPICRKYEATFLA